MNSTKSKKDAKNNNNKILNIESGRFFVGCVHCSNSIPKYSNTLSSLSYSIKKILWYKWIDRPPINSLESIKNVNIRESLNL